MTEILFQTSHGAIATTVTFLPFRDARRFIQNMVADLMAQGTEISFISNDRVTTRSGRSVFIKGA